MREDHPLWWKSTTRACCRRPSAVIPLHQIHASNSGLTPASKTSVAFCFRRPVGPGIHLVRVRRMGFVHAGTFVLYLPRTGDRTSCRRDISAYYKNPIPVQWLHRARYACCRLPRQGPEYYHWRRRSSIIVITTPDVTLSISSRRRRFSTGRRYLNRHDVYRPATLIRPFKPGSRRR